MAEEPRGSKTGDESQPWVSSAVLCLALSLSFTSTWLLNAVGYPAVDGFCPQGRLVAPLVGALAAALFSLLSQNHPPPVHRAFYAVGNPGRHRGVDGGHLSLV